MKHLIIILVGFLVFGMTGYSARGDMSMKLDIELKIQEKLRALIQPIDPHAQVNVTAKIKQITTTLPGTGTQVQGLFSTTSENMLSYDDIQTVDVKIISALDPFPDALKTVLDDGLDIPKNKKRFQYIAMDESTRKILASQENLNQVPRILEDASAGWQKFFQSLRYLLVLVFAFTTVLFYLNGRRQKRFQQAIQASLSNLGEGHPERQSIEVPSRVVPAGIPYTQAESRMEDKTTLQSLTISSLVSLFSDCYWTSEDGYAAWLWSQISPQQRAQVLDRWKTAESYIAFLAKVEKTPQTYHHHPYYLKPLELQDVSQSDLSAWLKRYPGAWHYLSPLRQARIPISLSDKMEFNVAPPLSELPKLPAVSQSIRELRPPIEIGAISVDDELALLENPALVPVSLRENVPSLVWIALLDREKREQMLATISAQNLAEVWIGPKAVLSRLEDVIPEKKRQLILDYQRQIAPSRESPTMRFLVKQALKVAEEPRDEGTYENKAA